MRAKSRRALTALGAFVVAIALGVFATPIAAATSNDIDPPLATTVQTATGTWATVPMGHLNQTLNTFWQLFFRAPGTTSWVDQVRNTAVATNGGLVFASAAGQPFIAAVRPSEYLHFSPLIYTSDGGRTWSDGVVPQGLAPNPDALSTSPNGRTLALVDTGLGARVLASSGNLSTWQTVATARGLASGKDGESCGLRTLSAVASLDGHAVVGASCSRPGVVGVFVQYDGGWELEAPTLPRALVHEDVQVVTLASTTSGLTALLRTAGTSGAALIAVWTTNGRQWSVSRPLSLSLQDHLVSVGAASANGLFALSKTSSGSTRLSVIDGPNSLWSQLPAPPHDTATVAFDPDGAATIDALVARVHDHDHLVARLRSALMGERASPSRRDQVRLLAMTLWRESRLAKKAGAVPCDRIRQAISAAFDGERPGLRAKVINADVTHCRGCKHYQEGIVVLSRQPNLQTSRPVPLALTDRLAAEWSDARDQTPPIYPRSWQRAGWGFPWRRAVPWLGSLAPAAVVLVVVPLGALSSPPVRPTPASTPCTIHLRSIQGHVVAGGASAVMTKPGPPR